VPVAAAAGSPLSWFCNFFGRGRGDLGRGGGTFVGDIVANVGGNVPACAAAGAGEAGFLRGAATGAGVLAGATAAVLPFSSTFFLGSSSSTFFLASSSSAFFLASSFSAFLLFSSSAICLAASSCAALLACSASAFFLASSSSAFFASFFLASASLAAFLFCSLSSFSDCFLALASFLASAFESLSLPASSCEREELEDLTLGADSALYLIFYKRKGGESGEPMGRVRYGRYRADVCRTHGAWIISNRLKSSVVWRTHKLEPT